MQRKKLLYVFLIAVIAILTIGCTDTKISGDEEAAFKDNPTEAYCTEYIEFDDAIAQLTPKEQLKELKKLEEIAPGSIKTNYERLIKGYEEKLADKKVSIPETTLREDSETLQRYSVQKCDMFKRDSAL